MRSVDPLRWLCSSGKAAELLGMTKREFIRLLARKGIPYFDYSPEELAEEFETVEAWEEVYQDVLAKAGNLRSCHYLLYTDAQ